MNLDPRLIALGTERRRLKARMAEIDEELKPLVAAAEPPAAVSDSRGVQRALVDITGWSRDTIRLTWRRLNGPRTD